MPVSGRRARDGGYAQGLVPGLLQTGAYAREIIAGTGPNLGPADVAALVEVRKKRQAVLTDLPNLTIQVMPKDAPAHPGMAGPFHVVRFSMPWPTVINLENFRGGYFVEGTDDVKAFESCFELIVAAALPVDVSRETIKKIMEGEQRCTLSPHKS